MEEIYNLQPGWEPVCPPSSADSFFDHNNHFLRKPGDLIRGDMLAYLKNSQSGDADDIRYEGKGDDELLEISYIAPPSPLFGGQIRIVKTRGITPLGIGDKLMGRYGNKGVVSCLLPPDKMPRLPDNPRLPEQLRGKTVDLVLNPHGVISRMNLGQLMECTLTLAQVLDPSKPLDGLGKPFKSFDADQKWALDCFENLAKEPDSPLDKYGRIYLNLPGGGRTEAPVVVGIQYFHRLRHVAAEKASARGQGKTYSPITGQPVAGKQRNGGQRLGEMEIWALAAHRACENLKEVLTSKSCDPAYPGSNGRRTFEAIKDHLFALGVVIDWDGNITSDIQFRWATDTDVKEKNATGEVTESDIWHGEGIAPFFCPECIGSSQPLSYISNLVATRIPQRGHGITHNYLLPKFCKFLL